MSAIALAVVGSVHPEERNTRVSERNDSFESDDATVLTTHGPTERERFGWDREFEDEGHARCSAPLIRHCVGKLAGCLVDSLSHSHTQTVGRFNLSFLYTMCL